LADVHTVVGVDLDDIDCYHAIHGLPPPDPARRGLALRRWLPRFLDLFAELGVTSTLFVIGKDVRSETAALRRAVAEGHELGNHSFAHAYDYVTWSAPDITSDLRRCDGLLRTLGATPRGFRAPGYTHDRRLLQLVAEAGYAYDSSALPSPPYWLAKVSVMTAMRLRGRKSASTARGGRSFFGATRPHRRADAGLCSIPVSVTPRLRLPLIGTSLLAGPLASRLTKAAVRLPFFNLELHAIDLADAKLDELSPELVHRQPGLDVPLSVRRERLGALLRARGQGLPLAAAVEAHCSKQ
jgi:hypothetical protein